MAIFEGFDDTAFTWNNVFRAVQDGTAATWFSEYPAVTGPEALEIAGVAWALDYAPMWNEWSVTMPFGVACEGHNEWLSLVMQYEAIESLGATESGQLVIGALHRAGIEEFHDQSHDIYVVHNLANGLHLSRVDVYDSPAGEYVEVSAFVLASELDPFEGDGSQRSLMSRFLAVPAVLQAAAFLAENPFPSSSFLFNFDRSIAYGDLAAEHRPRPFMDYVRTDNVVIPSLGDDGEVLLDYNGGLRSVVRFGFVIPLNLSPEELAACLSVVVNALPKINTMLENGFAVDDQPFSFQTMLASAAGLGDESGFRYVPYLSLVRELRPEYFATPDPVLFARAASGDHFACNDLGIALVHSGHREDGLYWLERSARAGVPWAMQSFSWCLLLAGDPSRAVSLFDETQPAMIDFATGQGDVAVRALVNATSNDALCRLALGGSTSEALKVWSDAERVGDVEAKFYPAIVAYRNRRPDDAHTIIDTLTPDERAEILSTLKTTAIEAVGWFAEWCRDGLATLGVESQPTSPIVSPSGASFCSNCGAARNPGGKYCGACGAAF